MTRKTFLASLAGLFGINVLPTPPAIAGPVVIPHAWTPEKLAQFEQFKANYELAPYEDKFIFHPQVLPKGWTPEYVEQVRKNLAKNVTDVWE